MENSSKIQHKNLNSLPSVIIFLILDYLPSETSFASMSILNKKFYLQLIVYKKLAYSLQITEKNSGVLKQFSRLSNLTIIFGVPGTEPTKIDLPKNLLCLKLIGPQNSNTKIQIFPETLEKFTYINPYKAVQYKLIQENFGIFNRLKYLNTDEDYIIKLPFSAQESNFSFEKLVVKNHLYCRNLDSILIRYPNIKKFKAYFNYWNRSVVSVITQDICYPNITELTFSKNLIDKQDSFINLVNCMPNLNSIILIGNLNINSFLFLVESCKYKLCLQKLFIVVQFKFNDSERIQEVLKILFESLKFLTDLKLVMLNWGKNRISTVKTIIECCKNHSNLYKFNCLPIKLLEDRHVSSLKLASNVFLDGQIGQELLKECVTSRLIYFYREKIRDIQEFRIINAFQIDISISISKILNKIQQKQVFLDKPNKFFSDRNFALLPILIPIAKNITKLNLEGLIVCIYTTKIFKELVNLKSFTGHYNKWVQKNLFNLQHLESLTITSLPDGFTYRNIIIKNLKKLKLKKIYIYDNCKIPLETSRTIKKIVFTQALKQNIIDLVKLGFFNKFNRLESVMFKGKNIINEILS